MGAHGDPRPATSARGPGRLPAPSPAAARSVTRAFPAEYGLSLAQPQPDAGEREQGLVSPSGKELARKIKVEDGWDHPVTEHAQSGGEAGNPENQSRVQGALPHPAPPLNPTGRMLRTNQESPKHRQKAAGRRRRAPGPPAAAALPAAVFIPGPRPAPRGGGGAARPRLCCEPPGPPAPPT